MLGAGVSTSAGIPDFRSPKTGLYANLARLNLPYPEAVFDVGFFRRNPEPFYTLAHELYPGKYRPTITHSFIRLLSDHGVLHFCFTQNIDTLERRAGIPDEKIIEAHGSFATQRCIDCKVPYDDAKMKETVRKKQVPICDSCHRGLIKPDIVFFGEQLPNRFLGNISAVNVADLLIVMGTSLTVHPFALLADLPNDLCPRVLINLDKVGSFGSRPDDVVLLGPCDDIVKQLCKELGWEDELTRLWEETAASVLVPLEPSADPEFHSDEEDEEDLYGTPDAEDEAESLAKKIAASMVLNDVTEKIQEKRGTEDTSSTGSEYNTPDAEDEAESSAEKIIASNEVTNKIQEGQGPKDTSATGTEKKSDSPDVAKAENEETGKL